MISKFKFLVKKILRLIGSIIPESSKNLKIYKRLVDDSAHIFFGYYDISPFSCDDKKILACRVSLENFGINKMMDIGYYDLSNDELSFKKINETTAWCWQMGPRLRWLNNEKNYVAFNSFEDNKHNCIIQDSQNLNIVEKYPLPFYDLNKDDTLGLSLNFSRLQQLRPGYGYKNLIDKSENYIKENDGIILFNLKTKTEKKLFTLLQINQIDPDETMINAEHYFNHISFCPFSNDFIFFHLWTYNEMRYRRLFFYDMELEKVTLLSSNLVSHYAWKSEDEILITEIDRMKLKYKLYNVNKLEYEVIGEGILIEDGHPSFINNNKILTDTYPNLFGHQKLRIYDSKNNKIIEGASFYSPPDFVGENKCDLHPRLSRNNQFISIDTAMSGKRQMLILSNY